MRILHISKYYYPYIGGVENICRYLVENMPQYDIAVVCFSTERKDVIEDVWHQGLPCSYMDQYFSSGIVFILFHNAAPGVERIQTGCDSFPLGKLYPLMLVK
jgi:hypothetical protein